MGVRIDETRNKHVSGPIHDYSRAEALGGLMGRDHGDNPAVADRDRVILEHEAGRLYRYAPASLDEYVALLHLKPNAALLGGGQASWGLQYKRIGMGC